MSSSTASFLSAILGLVLGHVLTRSWQLQQWKLENRKAEYRELLSKLSAGYMAALSYNRWSTTEGREESAKVEFAATACIKDRIFIADAIIKCNLLERWLKALHAFDHAHDSTSQRDFQKEFEAIRADLVRLALRDSAGAFIEDELA